MTTVNTNIQALSARQALTVNSRALNDAMAQLSTGKRLNSASDDAAGSAISTLLTTQARSLNMAVKNTNDSISMMQTADGAAAGIQDMLYRMKELAVQAANDTYSLEQKTSLDDEFQLLENQITHTISNTKWNDMNLLDGSLGNNTGVANYHIGAASGSSVEVDFEGFNVNNKPLAGVARSIDTAANANLALSSIDGAIDQISSARAAWGAAMNVMVHAGNNAMQVSQNLSESNSRIMDTDYAQTTAELARAMILDQAGKAMLSQANQQPYYVLALLS
jgi:flagellin